MLNELQVEYSLIEHSKSGKTSELAAEAMGEERGNIIKSMLLKNDKSEYLGIVIGGDQKIDFDKLRECARAKGKFKSNKFSLARPEEIKKMLGFDVGGVPPFAFYMNGIAAFVDTGVEKKDHVIGAGGNEFSGIRFSPGELSKFGYLFKEVSR